MSISARALSSLLVLLVTLPAALLAHARLERSEPAADARLTRAPRELRLVFTEKPERAVSSLTLVGPDGRTVPLGALRVPADAPRVLVAEILGALREGPYVVRWRTAMADGHPLRGSFGFTIEPGAEGSQRATPPRDSARQAAHPPPAAPPEEGPTDAARSVSFVLVRWMTLLALVLSLAGPAFVVLVLPRTWTSGDELSRAILPPARERVRRVGVAASSALVLTAVARLSAQSVALHGLPGAMDPALVGALLARTTWGHAWILQTVTALALAVTLAAARRSDAAWKVALLLGLPLALGAALSGHAASSDAGVPLAVALDMLHVLGASTWLGGLAMLMLAAIPATASTHPSPTAVVSALVNAFSPIALACGALVVVSGTIAASLHLHTPVELVTTSYGRVLLLKLALVIGALAAGAYNWRRVRPALAREDAVGRLRRVASVEMAATLFILLVTAVLIATPPPR